MKMLNVKLENGMIGYYIPEEEIKRLKKELNILIFDYDILDFDVPAGDEDFNPWGEYVKIKFFYGDGLKKKSKSFIAEVKE